MIAGEWPQQRLLLLVLEKVQSLAPVGLVVGLVKLQSLAPVGLVVGRVKLQSQEQERLFFGRIFTCPLRTVCKGTRTINAHAIRRLENI